MQNLIVFATILAAVILTGYALFLLEWQTTTVDLYGKRVRFRRPRNSDAEIREGVGRMNLHISGKPLLSFMSFPGDVVGVSYFGIRGVVAKMLLDGVPYTQATKGATKRHNADIVEGSLIWVMSTDLTKKWIINIRHPWGWKRELPLKKALRG